MFPILSTALAVIVCLVGLDFSADDADLGVSPYALLQLLIVPLGELLVLLARRKVLGPFMVKLSLRFFALFPLSAFAASIFFLGWIHLPRLLGVDGWVAIDTLVLFASYLALSNVTRFYRNRFARTAGLLPAAYVRAARIMAIKGELTVLTPFFLFVLFNDLVELDEGINDLFTHLPVVFWISLFAIFLLLVLSMPLLLKLLWRLKPMDTPLRNDLEGFVTQLGFRVRDILVWDTGGLLVNAAILGLTRRTRYIVFTDAMVERLTPLEIKAVLAHEVGHGINRHLQIYLVFSMAFVFGLSLLENLIPPLIRLEGKPEEVFFLIAPAVLLYWWLVFGFLSRRFEMEADIFGAAGLGDPLLFMNTLDRVARAGRVERKKTSWRHFSIERRIESLKKVFFVNPVIAYRFWRKMRGVRLALVGLSSILFVLFAGDMAVDTVAGLGTLAYKEGDYETAERYLTSATHLPTGEIHRFSLYKLYLSEKKSGEAFQLLEDMTRPLQQGAAPEVMRTDVMGLLLLCTDQDEIRLYHRTWALAERLYPGDPEFQELGRLTTLHLAGDTAPLEAWIEERYGPLEGRRSVP